jgi:hypothetical protein
MIAEVILPFPKDELIAKCSPRGWGNGGNVVWTSFFARGYVTADNAEPLPQTTTVGDTRMAYKMEHHTSTKQRYRTIDDIIITNLFCGHGKGWDVIICGTLVQHFNRKSDAQREAETLLEGKC